MNNPRSLSAAVLSAVLPVIPAVVVAGAVWSSTGCTRAPPAAPPATSAPTPAAPPAVPSSDHAGSGHAHEVPEPTTEKSAAFLFPQDGSTVFSDVDVAFRISGMDLKKAGEDPTDRGSGHHHLIVDSPAVPAGQLIPRDDRHLHFDDGKARVSVHLPPGPHDLEMQLADGAHRSWGPALAARIHVTVVEAPPRVGVSFVDVKDGDTVSAPVKLKLGVAGFALRPAGGDVRDKTSGHFHVIVDDDPVLAGTTIPDDGTHLCAKGDSEIAVPVPPGPHRLTVQLADAAHASYGPRMASTITVTVK